MNTDWKTGRIGDFYRPTRKPRELKYREHDIIPFVPMDAVPLGGHNRLSWIEKTPDELTSGTYFERGDVLVARITPSFENGKQAVADDLPKHFGVGSTELIPLQEIPDVSDRWFLFYFLLLGSSRRELAGKMEGSTGRQRLPDSVLLDYPMQLPPLDEQRRIAAVLTNLQRAVALEAAQKRAMRELKQAVMRRLFTRGLRHEPLRETPLGPLPESWHVKTLGSIARIGNGSTPKRTNSAYWTAGKIPWLTSGKIHESVISAADEFVTKTAREECHLPTVRAGSVLVAITGQGKTLGNSALVTFDTTISQHLAYLTFSQAETSAEFVWRYLQSRYDHLQEVGRGGGSTKAALTCHYLKDYPIPFPPPAEQREIAAILGAIDRKAAAHATRQKALGDLFRTTLHALMTARLRVPEGLVEERIA